VWNRTAAPFTGSQGRVKGYEVFGQRCHGDKYCINIQYYDISQIGFVMRPFLAVTETIPLDVADDRFRGGALLLFGTLMKQFLEEKPSRWLFCKRE
jgi:hypothetical protein